MIRPIMILIRNDLLRHWHKLNPRDFDESDLMSIFLPIIQLTSAEHSSYDYSFPRQKVEVARLESGVVSHLYSNRPTLDANALSVKAP